MPEESKNIISQKAKERYKDKTANPMYGKTHSAEAIKKQSECKKGSKNPMFGTKWTDRQKELCGTRGKKLNLTEEQRQVIRERTKIIGKTTGLKPVKCIEDDSVYPSVTEAASAYGVAISTLSGHLNKCQKSCRGKHFEYLN